MLTKIMAAVCLTWALTMSAQAAEEHHRDGDSRSISQVNSSIDLEDGAQADQLESVNGSIRVGDHAVIASAHTVNGSVRLGNDCRARTLSTVNGSIKVGRRTAISGDITTVNGRIELSDDADVQGDARNVNSDITLGQRAHVGGKIVTRSGDITLQDNARVDRGIEVKDDGWWRDVFGSLFSFTRHAPVITIGPGAQVGGELVFDREVELRVHSTAKIGHVTGATVRNY
jgi:predicted acyltransferase (DUF342 family)